MSGTRPYSGVVRTCATTKVAKSRILEYMIAKEEGMEGNGLIPWKCSAVESRDNG